MIVFFFFFKMIQWKIQEHYISHGPFPVRVCFRKSLNNVKPLKPKPGHISVLPGVQQNAAEYGSPPGRGSPAFPETSCLGHRYTPRASPQQLVIAAVAGPLERRDWRTITQSRHTGWVYYRNTFHN